MLELDDTYIIIELCCGKSIIAWICGAQLLDGKVNWQRNSFYIIKDAPVAPLPASHANRAAHCTKKSEFIQKLWNHKYVTRENLNRSKQVMCNVKVFWMKFRILVQCDLWPAFCSNIAPWGIPERLFKDSSGAQSWEKWLSHCNDTGGNINLKEENKKKLKSIN